MSKFTDALTFVNGNNDWDGTMSQAPKLIHHSEDGHRGFLYVKCSESTDKKELAESLSKLWKKEMDFERRYSHNGYYEMAEEHCKACTKREEDEKNGEKCRWCEWYHNDDDEDFNDGPGFVQLPDGNCEYRIEGDVVIFEFPGLYIQVYGTDLGAYMDMWNLSFCKFMFNEFFSKYPGCIYESVLMPVQGDSVCDMGGIFISTNDPEEKYEYSFSRLLPAMLETLKDDYKQEQLIKQLSLCNWVPKEWYDYLLNETKDTSLKAMLLEVINQKFGNSPQNNTNLF